MNKKKRKKMTIMKIYKQNNFIKQIYQLEVKILQKFQNKPKIKILINN